MAAASWRHNTHTVYQYPLFHLIDGIGSPPKPNPKHFSNLLLSNMI